MSQAGAFFNVGSLVLYVVCICLNLETTREISFNEEFAIDGKIYSTASQPVKRSTITCCPKGDKGDDSLPWFMRFIIEEPMDETETDLATAAYVVKHLTNILSSLSIPIAPRYYQPMADHYCLLLSMEHFTPPEKMRNS